MLNCEYNYELLFVVFQITQKLKSLPQTVPTLLQEVLGRIETDLGKDLVSTAMSLLVSARDGESGFVTPACSRL